MKRSSTKSTAPKKKPKVSTKKIKDELDALWSKAIKARDKKCLKCGSNGNLNAHHVFGRRHNSTRWILDNGVSLCYPCHIHWAHHDVGSFAAWFIELKGGAKFDMLNRLSKSAYQDKDIDFTGLLMALNNSILISEMEGR